MSNSTSINAVATPTPVPLDHPHIVSEMRRLADELAANEESYNPPRKKMSWERLERELIEANARITHYLAESRVAADEIETLRSHISHLVTEVASLRSDREKLRQIGAFYRVCAHAGEKPDATIDKEYVATLIAAIPKPASPTEEDASA